MQVIEARTVPKLPNRLGRAGIEVAREKKKFSCDTAHNDRTCSVDRDQITCYNYGMKNNNASKTPSIATLIRDGYLQEHEAGDANYVTRAKMEWMDDYAAFLLDEINND